MVQVQKHAEAQTVVGRYPLIEPLGSTPHSSVFRTECDAAPDRQAAIKLIPAPAAGSEAQLTRWRLAARFSHPALLRIFDMGRCEFEGRPMLYAVMELAEENLAEILPVRSLSSDETRGMLAPVLEALAYLHNKGFVHGSLQPSNILAIADQVKLSIESISRIGEKAVAREPVDSYCAPESVSSAASDVWSLGVTVVQCLTRRAPERESAGSNALLLPKSLPAPFLDFARHCLNPIPQRRWTVPQLQAALGLQRAASPVPAVASAAESISAPAPSVQPLAAALASSKPDFVSTIRRRFVLKKQHRLILAGLAAASAAFVLGIVISAANSNNSPTAIAPVPASATAPLASASHEAVVTSPNRPTVSAAALKSKREPEKLRAENEKDAPAQSARSVGPSVIVSNVVPAEPAQLSSPSSAGVVPGAVTRRALPRIPARATDSIWGTVRVSVIVDVDPRGHVVEAKLGSAGPSQYFARLSMAAAQDWKFVPPRVNGSIVPSQWLIDFGYSKSDTSATASERHP